MEQKKKKTILILLFGGVIVICLSLFLLLLVSATHSAKNYQSKTKKDWNWPTNYHDPSPNDFEKFEIELRKKGYSESDIRHISQNFRDWGWELTSQYLPNLRAEQRIGVIKQLGYFQIDKDNLPEAEKGHCSDLVVIVRKKTNKNHTDPIINFDHRLNREVWDHEKRIINFILQQENNQQALEIAILEIVGGMGIKGTSAGVASALALLSTLHQKPISCQVAASGEFREGQILPVGSLRAKITAAFRQGVNRLILARQHQTMPPSENNGPFQSFFNAFNNTFTENYHQQVPEDIRKNMTTYFIENYQNLQTLFWSEKLS